MERKGLAGAATRESRVEEELIINYNNHDE